MTVSSVIPRVVYTGNGAGPSTFAVARDGQPIVFASNAEIVVAYRDPTTQAISILTEGVHYSLTGTPTSGIVTRFAGPLPNLAQLVIYRSVNVAQETDLIHSGDFSSAAVEAALDYRARVEQDLIERLQRRLRTDIFDTAYDALSKRITNVANGVNPQDCVTVAQLVAASIGDIEFDSDIGPQRPIFLLATGQSRFVLNYVYAWTPAPNLKIWNFNGTPGSVGTSFQNADSAVMNLTWREASEIAYANPTRPVYLLNVSNSGQPIAQWKAGASSPDMFADIVANIVPALAAAGVTKIDRLSWGQGEGDAYAPANYVADFETVINRFKSQAWFPDNTPIVVHGINSFANGASAEYGAFTVYQQATVAADPDNRMFVNTATLPAATHWAGDFVHMTGLGTEAAGIMGAQAYLGRSGRGHVAGVTVTEAGGVALNGAIPATDAAVTASRNTTKSTRAWISQSDIVAHLVGMNGQSARALIDAYGGTPSIISRHANGTLASPSATLSGDLLFLLGTLGYSTSQYGNFCAGLLVAAAENHTSSAMGTNLDLLTTPKGSTFFERAVQITHSKNVKVGGNAERGTTEGSNQVVLFNGTAPAGTLANGASFYCASGEMRVMDAAGNNTLLSPHDRETNDWIYDSLDTTTGKRLRIDMERMMKAINDRFGWDFVHEFIEPLDGGALE